MRYITGKRKTTCGYYFSNNIMQIKCTDDSLICIELVTNFLITVNFNNESITIDIVKNMLCVSINLYFENVIRC